MIPVNDIRQNKVSLVIVLFIIGGFPLMAQREYPPCDAYTDRENDTLLVTSSYSNTLYIGMDNIIHVKLKDSACRIKTDNGQIFKDDEEEDYCLLPKEQGTAVISLEDTVKGRIIYKKAFFVKKLPPLKVSLCDLILNNAERVNRLFLLSCDSINVYYTDDIVGADKWLEVTRFTIGYNYGTYFVEFASRDNHYTSQMEKALREVRTGSVMRVNITCKDKTGFKIVLPVISFKIY